MFLHFNTRWNSGTFKAKHIKERDRFLNMDKYHGVLPLCAVGVARVTLVVGLGILEDETVGPLQPIGALLHAVWPIFEVAAFHALVRALRGEHGEQGACDDDRG